MSLRLVASLGKSLRQRRASPLLLRIPPPPPLQQHNMTHSLPCSVHNHQQHASCGRVKSDFLVLASSSSAFSTSGQVWRGRQSEAADKVDDEEEGGGGKLEEEEEDEEQMENEGDFLRR